jgi:hypothetical protein
MYSYSNYWPSTHEDEKVIKSILVEANLTEANNKSKASRLIGQLPSDHWQVKAWKKMYDEWDTASNPLIKFDASVELVDASFNLYLHMSGKGNAYSAASDLREMVNKQITVDRAGVYMFNKYTKRNLPVPQY